MARAEFNNIKKGIKSIQGTHFTEATNANAKHIIWAQYTHTHTHIKQALSNVVVIYLRI